MPLGEITAPGELEARPPEQAGHRVGRVEAVAEVGDEVEPKGSVLFVGRSVGKRWAGGRVQGRLELALVGVLAEEAGDDDAESRVDEDTRAEPANHRLAFELEVRDAARPFGRDLYWLPRAHTWNSPVSTHSFSIKTSMLSCSPMAAYSHFA